METLDLLVQMVQLGIAGAALVSLSLALRMAHQTIRLHVLLSYGKDPTRSVIAAEPGERSGASPDGDNALTDQH